MNAIELTSVSAGWQGKDFLKNLSFRVQVGEFVALLGANGAGKTTTMNVLADLLAVSAGTVKIFEQTPRAAKLGADLVLVPQNLALYPELTVKENLEFWAGLYLDSASLLTERLAEMRRVFELDAVWRRPVGKLSGGFQRRVSFAAALAPRPRLLLLDEPLTGIDVLTRRLIFDYLKAQTGLTVILATHALDLAEEYCHRALFLHAGRLLAELKLPDDLAGGSLRRYYDNLILNYENLASDT